MSAVGGPNLEAARTSPVPLYIVDGDEVHRVPPFYDSPIFGEDEPIEQLERNLDAVCR